MNSKKLVFSFLALFVFYRWSFAAQEAAPTAGLQASNLLNPNVSAIGWFQAEVGHRQKDPADPKPEDTEAIQLKEVELAFQSVIDPYSRADFIVSITQDGAEVEEGTINWFALPHGWALKAGKFKANFGRFNRIHAGETSFADRPTVEEKFFGEEGLAGSGGSLSWQIPNDVLLLNLDLEAMTSPQVDEVPAFDRGEKKDLLYVGRLGGYVDLTEKSNISFGSSYAHGPAGEASDPVSNSSTTLHSQIVGADLTFRWKNPRRAIYRSFVWNTEALWSHRDVSIASTENSWGLFSHIEYQFARRWKAGGRYDYAETPTDKTNETKGGLVYLTFNQSEFCLISLQGKHSTLDDGTHEDLAFLKTTFNIGPHGAHPF